MSDNILKEALLFEETKQGFSPEDRKIIRASLMMRCNANLKKLTNTFINAIDKIND